MDALSVVTQLRDLASEPQNREEIVRDQGCLPGLVLFLDHQDQDVLLATLQVGGWMVHAYTYIYLHIYQTVGLSLNVSQALRYLAELPPNVPIMKNELGMMVSLENVALR